MIDSEATESGASFTGPGPEPEESIGSANTLDIVTAGSGSASAALLPARIGRYALLGKLGQGGMGVVYACYDEDLDRKIAVKLLRPGVYGQRTRARLHREAQGLARLSHPNVVQIYEFGEHKGALFLAMEYVLGATLRTWLAREPARPWTEVLAILIQAGRGLEAAHGAGLVHRDFKPDNVLVGEDGRARVLDFGLVRELERASDEDLTISTVDDEFEAATLSESGRSTTDERHGGSALRRDLTEHGTVMGTPAYMAPEQYRGLPATAATDQFSFCLASFEALFGQRPFCANTLVDLQQAILTGDFVKVDSAGVPRQIRHALERGLAYASEDRWPDMSALLDVLERARGRGRRRKRGALVGLGLVAALTVGAALASGDDEPELCVVDESALAGTWDDERRAAVRRAFEATQLDYAPATFRIVEAGLDRWSTQWRAARREACRATRIEGSQSEALLDARTRCLDRKRRAFGARVALLGEADIETVASAALLLEGLPEVETCADPELVDARFPLPEDPHRAAAINRGYETLARADALVSVGKIDGAQPLIEALRAEIDTLDHPPLRLELALEDGAIALRRRELDSASTLHRDIAREAERLHLDELVATARTRLAVELVGEADTERARDLVLDARAAVERLDRDEDPRRRALVLAEGRLLEAEGQLEAALTLFDHAERRFEDGAEAPDHRVLQDQARVLAALGRLDQAQAKLEAARARAEASWGPGSVAVAHVDFELGLLAQDRGAFEAAEGHLDRAETSYRQAFGDDAVPVARVELARAKLAMVGGELERALALVEHVTAVYADARGVQALRQADALEALGVLRFFAGDIEGTLVPYRRALDLRERALGPDHPSLAQLHSNLGESHAALGDHERALAEYAKALAGFGRSLPADHPGLALPLKGRGQSLLALGQPAAAVTELERALALQGEAEPFELADIRASLARALIDRDRDRARELAELAAEDFDALNMNARAEELRAWLRAH